MEGLQSETLELLQRTAVAASDAAGKLAIVAAKAEPEHVYYTVDPQGKAVRQIADPKPRAHRLVTLDEVIRFVQEKGGPETVVWYDRTGVVVVLDDATRRDVARLELSLTPQMRTLERLEKDRPSLPQKEFRRLLKVELAGCFLDARLLNWISNVKWNSGAATFGNVRADRESLGREIDEAAISESGDFPEDVPLAVRVFDDPSLAEPSGVRALAEIDFSVPAFRLTPLPLELHNAIELQLAYVGEKLRGELGDEEGASVFRGRP